jgi:hypothetical protein
MRNTPKPHGRGCEQEMNRKMNRPPGTRLNLTSMKDVQNNLRTEVNKWLTVYFKSGSKYSANSVYTCMQMEKCHLLKLFQELEVVHTCNFSTQQAKARGSQVQSQHGLHSK